MQNSFINLRATLECGQVFHWRGNPDGSWEGLIADSPAAVWEKNGRLKALRGDKGLIV